MDYIPCRERTFLFMLAPWFVDCYKSYLRLLKHLLERLGRECTFAVWQKAHADYHDELLMQILSTKWDQVAANKVNNTEDQVASLMSELFPLPIEKVSKEEAQQLIEQTPPIYQVKQLFSSLDVQREMTTFEALHLRLDGVALLIESLINHHGKQGELIAYDMLLEGRIAAGQGRTGSVEKFISEFIAEPTEPNIFTAGLEIEVIQASDRECVIHIKECEWARYFQEHHPQVRYLIACSTDEAAIKAFNKHLRLQRTSTLMEGGKVCDFRIYAVEETTFPSREAT